MKIVETLRKSSGPADNFAEEPGQAESLNQRVAAVNLEEEQAKKMNYNYMIDAVEI